MKGWDLFKKKRWKGKVKSLSLLLHSAPKHHSPPKAHTTSSYLFFITLPTFTTYLFLPLLLFLLALFFQFPPNFTLSFLPFSISLFTLLAFLHFSMPIFHFYLLTKFSLQVSTTIHFWIDDAFGHWDRILEKNVALAVR